MIRKILRVFVGLINRIRFRYYKANSELWGKVLLGELFLGGSILYQVPVRYLGKGTISIFSDVKLGYADAARFGDGHLLLQARDPHATIVVGEKTAFSNNITLIARESIRIGAGCLIGDGVLIIDSDFHGISPEARHTSSGESSGVVLGDNVWLGSRVIVMKGSRIGDGSIIGAGSVVVGSIPSRVIACGSPAKVVRKL